MQENGNILDDDLVQIIYNYEKDKAGFLQACCIPSDDCKTCKVRVWASGNHACTRACCSRYGRIMRHQAMQEMFTDVDGAEMVDNGNRRLTLWQFHVPLWLEGKPWAQQYPHLNRF